MATHKAEPLQVHRAAAVRARLRELRGPARATPFVAPDAAVLSKRSRRDGPGSARRGRSRHVTDSHNGTDRKTNRQKTT